MNDHESSAEIKVERAWLRAVAAGQRGLYVPAEPMSPLSWDWVKWPIAVAAVLPGMLLSLLVGLWVLCIPVAWLLGL
jgi:hypothetical protein